jgi:hypothetical protein
MFASMKRENRTPCRRAALVSRMPFLSVVLCASLAAPLLGCGGGQVSFPVAVRPRTGEAPLRGMGIASLSGGNFSVASSKARCSGTYNVTSSTTATVTAQCSDGRSGTGQSYRTAPSGGSGLIRMSDGAEVDFAFGTEIPQTSTAAMAPAPSIAPTISRSPPASNIYTTEPRVNSAFDEARELAYSICWRNSPAWIRRSKKWLELHYRSPAYLEEAGAAMGRGMARGLNKR